MDTSSALRSTVFTLLLSLPLSPAAAAATQRIGCLWDKHADSPVARFEAGTLPIDGQLYCFGGFFTQAIEATTRVDAYDPVNDVWNQLADMPDATTHVGFVREGRNVWLLGGFIGDNPGVATSDVWVYDIDLNAYSAGPSLPRPIAAGGAAVFGRELHYFGGCEADRNTMTGDHWVLDLDNQAAGWMALAPVPEPRCHLSGAVLAGEIWAVGGQLNHDVNPLDTRWVHAYDPATDTWRQGPLLPEPRSHFEPATFVENGNLYIAAGKNLTVGQDILSGMLEFDPVLGAWSYLAPLPNPRYGAGAQVVNGRLYAANGAAEFNDPQTDLFSRDFSATLPSPFRINCGGPEVVASTGSCCWCGDVGFQNGNVRAFNPQAEVFGTDDDAVFDHMRQSTFPQNNDVDYRLPMGDGFFRVTLHLAERQTMTTGARRMDVTIEGMRVAESIDVLDEAGFATAITRAYDVLVTDGAIDINLDRTSSMAVLVAGLEIEALGPDHFEYECTSAPNSTGSAATIDFVGSSSLDQDRLTFSSGPVPANTFGLYIQAELAGAAMLPGGTLCVQQPFFRLPVEQATSAGILSHDLTITSPPTLAQQIVVGSTWRFQGWYRDVLTPAGYGLTDAVKLVFTP